MLFFFYNYSLLNEIQDEHRFNCTNSITVARVNKKVGNLSRGQPEGSLFNSYKIEVYGRALLLSLDCSTLPLIRTLYGWVLSKEVLSIIFKVFGITQPGTESRSPGPMVNTLPTKTNESVQYIYIIFRKVSREIKIILQTCAIQPWRKPKYFKRNYSFLWKQFLTWCKEINIYYFQ